MSSDPVPKSPSSEHSWPRTVLGISIVLVFAGSGLYVFKSCRDLPGDAASKSAQIITNVGRVLVDVAAAFNQRTISTSFASYASTLSANQFLQFATLRQIEVFTQTDQATTGFGYLPLPEVIVEAQAPVEYTYYLDLKAKWDFVLTNNVVYVLAPPIRFNKPSLDASEITFEIKKGSVLRDEEQARDNLKKSLTSLAHLRAREHVQLIRETGRRQVTEFAETWLANNFADGRKYPVKVFFPGEVTPVPRPVDPSLPRD